MQGPWEWIAWIAAAGALGGALNAMVTDNASPWPTCLSAGPDATVTRPGLLLCVAVAALASAGVSAAYIGVACSVAPTFRELVIGTTAALMVGVLTSRWLTNETDKRLLRLAALKAAAAPAAHPDTVSAILFASPHRALTLAAGLELHAVTGLHIPVSSGFDALTLMHGEHRHIQPNTSWTHARLERRNTREREKQRPARQP